MAFDKMQLYMIRFTAPDGEHIAAGHSTTNIEHARNEFERIITMNPEAVYDRERVVPATIEQIQAAERELREKDPSRPLATDMGFDTPNRILTDPHLVPGSKIAPPASGMDQL